MVQDFFHEQYHTGDKLFKVDQLYLFSPLVNNGKKGWITMDLLNSHNIDLVSLFQGVNKDSNGEPPPFPDLKKYKTSTLPKTNTAPENGWLED